MKIFLDKLKNKQDLSFNESKNAFEILMDGKASDDEIFDFLTLLSSKGEISDEIAGGVYVLRNKSKRVNVKDCIDTCGTGGDGMNTLNISTASALLLSSMGIKVAKHGNKAVSSKCGSGDVLEALNIKINLEPKDIEEQIKKNNFGFMFAPNYHSAMRFVGPTRKKIGKKKHLAWLIAKMASKDWNLNKDIIVIIGPEGGFVEEERSLISKNSMNFGNVRMGQSILKSDTAVIAALSLTFHYFS